MRFRKVRIAWSVFCGVVAMLLVVLWVRSYWRVDVFRPPNTQQRIESLWGTIAVDRQLQLPGEIEQESRSRWRWESSSIGEYEEWGLEVGPEYLLMFRVGGPWMAPYWLMMLFTVAVAAAPWSRRHISLRNPRIAWSASWSAVCLLLVLLWVNSYRFSPTAFYYDGKQVFRLVVLDGGISFEKGASTGMPHWGIASGDRDVPFRKTSAGFVPDKIVSVAIVPLWVVTALSAASAAVPWLRWRFSLSTLFIVTTVMAAVLGWVAYAAID